MHPLQLILLLCTHVQICLSADLPVCHKKKKKEEWVRGRVFSLGVNLLESRMGVDLRPSLTAGMSCILGVTMTSTWPHWFPVYMALAPSLI